MSMTSPLSQQPRPELSETSLTPPLRPEVAPSGQLTFSAETLGTLLSGQSTVPVQVGSQSAELRRIAPGVVGLAQPLFQQGGFEVAVGPRNIYLDNAGRCVEVRDATTGSRFHPRNIVIQSFLEGVVSAGIQGTGKGAVPFEGVTPVAARPAPLGSLMQSPPPQTAILRQESGPAWYLEPFNRTTARFLTDKGVSPEQIAEFANLVEKVYARHGMTLNRAQVIALTATALQENALSSKQTAGGLGAFQHTQSRATALRRFTPTYKSEYPGASDLEAQIAFTVHEKFGLEGFSGIRGGTHREAGALFRSATTVDQAMRAMRIFEGYGLAGNRYRFARELEQLLKRETSQGALI